MERMQAFDHFRILKKLFGRDFLEKLIPKSIPKEEYLAPTKSTM
jgi:hypothetical protein